VTILRPHFPFTTYSLSLDSYSYYGFKISTLAYKFPIEAVFLSKTDFLFFLPFSRQIFYLVVVLGETPISPNFIIINLHLTFKHYG
jgi:hypothetical protein